MAKKVLIHFDAKGNATVEAEGYEGGTCLDATAPFEALFGDEVKPREMVGDCAGISPDKGERVNYGG